MVKIYIKGVETLKMKKCTHIKEDKNIYLVNPLQTNIRNFEKIVSYYQYEAPEIDSIHSKGIINLEQKDNLFNKMMAIAKITNNNMFMNRISSKQINEYDFGTDVVCFKCQRILCRNFKKESYIDALLRHLRNGFAHGRVYIKKTKNQTYILIEDLDKGKDKKPSAFIMVTKSILEKWMKEIQKMTEDEVIQEEN